MSRTKQPCGVSGKFPFFIKLNVEKFLPSPRVVGDMLEDDDTEASLEPDPHRPHIVLADDNSFGHLVENVISPRMPPPVHPDVISRRRQRQTVKNDGDLDNVCSSRAVASVHLDVDSQTWRKVVRVKTIRNCISDTTTIEHVVGEKLKVKEGTVLFSQTIAII